MFEFCDERTKNSISLGICFVLLFSAYNALANIQKTLMESIETDNPSFTADGYQTQGILYTVFAIAMWTAPGIIAKIGPKLSMSVATSFYAFYFGTFYFENNIMVYIGACLCGVGASVLWVGQANYIVLNSTVGKVYKEVGIFWVLFQCSHFFGNLIVYFEFDDANSPINAHMRGRIILIFMGLAGTAMISLLFLRSPTRVADTEENRSPLKDMLKSCKIIATKHMLILCVVILTLEAHLTFLSVLSASMGFAEYLSDNSKELAPLCGLLQGSGAVSGGFLSIFIGGKMILKLKPIMTIGCLACVFAYIITILTLPNSALNNYTHELPILILPLGFLLAASLMVGLGDGCINTEVYDHIGSLYPNDSSSAFAVFNFVRNVSTSATFFYAKYLSLHLQVSILFGGTVLSFVAYHYLVHFSKPTDTLISNKKSSDCKLASIEK